jgi:hypothetical protein
MWVLGNSEIQQVFLTRKTLFSDNLRFLAGDADL